MIIVFSIIALLYFLLLLYILKGYGKVSTFNYQPTSEITSFTIVIPFRNEAKNLPSLLQSIMILDYPEFHVEFLLVDDDSEDNSVEIVQEYCSKNRSEYPLLNNVRVLTNNRVSNSPKKDAIKTGILASKYDWIVTTDADCIVPENWLLNLNSFIVQENPKMIVGPVTYKTESNFLDYFQLVDLLSLQMTTIGAFGLRTPILCNGANLAYKKSCFHSVNGFSGNDGLASGDDIFLMNKFKSMFGDSVRFLKHEESRVITYPVNSWNELNHQRLRWASKTSKVEDSKTKFLAAIILLGNLLFVYTVLAIVLNLNLYTPLWFIPFKVIIDIVFVEQLAADYEQRIPAHFLILSGLLYPFFSVLIVIQTFFSKYKWKDRSFKQ